MIANASTRQGEWTTQWQGAGEPVNSTQTTYQAQDPQYDDAYDSRTPRTLLDFTGSSELQPSDAEPGETLAGQGNPRDGYGNGRKGRRSASFNSASSGNSGPLKYPGQYDTASYIPTSESATAGYYPTFGGYRTEQATYAGTGELGYEYDLSQQASRMAITGNRPESQELTSEDIRQFSQTYRGNAPGKQPLTDIDESGNPGYGNSQDGLERQVISPKIIQGTRGDKEKLDPCENYVEQPVFKMLWVEPAGSNATNQTYLSEIRFGEQAYNNLRRFVVVKEGRDSCTCLPIYTYGKQGATKPGLTVEDHAIIYTGRKSPSPVLGEEAIDKEPIKVTADQGMELEALSRINFGKIYTVEHNVKVKNVGTVHATSIPKLLGYYRDTYFGDSSDI
ncbi:MAG: hypothetical protein M1827_006765 [Pycnora praestabilis]|nr:MAG: hypothetical protein M1827_006765 [Pycnora praestabilis]